MSLPIPSKFPLGRLVATRAATQILTHDDILNALQRHANGDWGLVCPSDWEINDEALKHGDRLLSAYDAKGGVRFWIITEADRSSTAVLLPGDY